MKIKNNIWDYLFLLIILFVMAVLLIYPKSIAEGIISGIMICVNVLIPSLFPFMVLSLIITESGVLAKICKNTTTFGIFVILLSVLGGYPVGAKIIAEYEKKGIASKSVAENLLCVSINAGPAFVITVVGTKVLNNTKLGLLLFCALLLSNVQLFFVLKLFKKETINISNINNSSFAEQFVSAVAMSSTAMISVCSYVILFSGLINFFSSNLPTLKNSIQFFEITNAVLNNKNIFSLVFCLGFSGVCVLMQVFSLGKDFIKQPTKIIFFRIIHGILSIINLKVLLFILPQNLSVFSNHIFFDYKTTTLTTTYSVLLISLVIFFIYSVEKKNYCGKISKDIW